MNENTEQRLYNEAVEKFGENFQIELAIEECGELVAELAKMQNGRDEANLEAVTEEIADVLTLMEQLMVVVEEDKVKKKKRQNLRRLERRLREVEK